jgi:hypothetical protein
MMLSASERADLDQLAAAAGTDASSYVRGLIAAAAAASQLSGFRKAEGPSSEAERNKAIRGQYLREIVTFAEAVDDAVQLWRAGKHEEAVELAARANTRPRPVGNIKRDSWAALFREHAGNKPGRRGKQGTWTTNGLVLSLISWNEKGEYPAKLSDGKTMLRRSTLETALGKRKGRRTKRPALR